MIVNRELAESEGVEQKDKWSTPDSLFNCLNDEFNFTLDPCCEVATAKCSSFFTIDDDGLLKDWGGYSVFVNPPYSRGNIDKWVRKCYKESQKPNTQVVALLPVSTSAKWFHEWIIGKGELRFVERRVRFVGAPFTAPFSSVIVVFGRVGIKSFLIPKTNIK